MFIVVFLITCPMSTAQSLHSFIVLSSFFSNIWNNPNINTILIIFLQRKPDACSVSHCFMIMILCLLFPFWWPPKTVIKIYKQQLSTMSTIIERNKKIENCPNFFPVVFSNWRFRFWKSRIVFKINLKNQKFLLTERHAIIY